jgi:hypothetical protein
MWTVPAGDYSLLLVRVCVCGCVSSLVAQLRSLVVPEATDIYSVPYIEEGARGQDKENSKGNVYACNSW